MARANAHNGAEPVAPQWPAAKVERRKPGDLKPFERNARTHTPAQIGEVANSISKWGFTFPILIDENDGIIAGHARQLAALQLRLNEVPVIVARGWSDADKRSYIIADNKIGLNSGWDWDLLALEVGDLRALGADLGTMGFTGLEVSSLLAEPTEGERHLADTDPAEDATWPTLEIKMPQAEFDRVNAALDQVGADLPGWRRLIALLFREGEPS
jgi:ParB-like chromosome segregation protein Spo0J